MMSVRGDEIEAFAFHTRKLGPEFAAVHYLSNSDLVNFHPGSTFNDGCVAISLAFTDGIAWARRRELTDAMVDAGLDSWLDNDEPVKTYNGIRKRFREALEAALGAR